VAGIAGPVLLAAYFSLPAFVHLPTAGASPGKLIAFADAHRLLFYLGGWFQVTGSLLSVAFLLVLLQLSGARRTLAGSAALIGCAVLLSMTAIEATLLEAVPMAAANGDHATVATSFALSTGGVFARIYPLAAAPLVFAGIGFALSASSILPRVFARTALLISGLFLLAGLAAVFGTAGPDLRHRDVGAGSHLDPGRRHRLRPADAAFPDVANLPAARPGHPPSRPGPE
jgi:hypothetical protein